MQVLALMTLRRANSVIRRRRYTPQPSVALSLAKGARWVTAVYKPDYAEGVTRAGYRV